MKIDVIKARPVLGALTLWLTACGQSTTTPPAATAPGSAATAATAAVQAAVAKELPLDDRQDFDDATHGLVGREPELTITGADGRVIWRTADNAFLNGPAPTTVNPSLWRQAQLNAVQGLFQVADGIYQVRGYDLSNLTLIRSQNGWIVVDPLTCRETATAALALAAKHLGPINVTAIIVTHSHIDHFGGIEAVLPADATARAAVRIVAPKGFFEEATSENVLAGATMGRRSTYMYGLDLPKSPTGHVTAGLGPAPARGTSYLAPPTDLVTETPQEMTLDGVHFVFQYVPDSEAPAELTFYLPTQRAFCGAEIVSHTMHNLYTLRGAKVRDALKWSNYIDEARDRFGDAEVVFASHHWPVWGNERVRSYLAAQRDTYKYIHDQTLRLASQGLTSQEIAETLTMPSTLAHAFASRGYYGTVRHNAKAVYQAYFGWFDGNPANLDPLPPEQIGAKYVDALGGAEQVLAKGRAAIDAGDYRWAATLLNHLVFAQPTNDAARTLLARAYEQLGYQAESGPWRDSYLTGAHELQHGINSQAVDLSVAVELFRRMPAARFFDLLSTRVVGTKADGSHITLNFVFTDLNETHVIELENAVLHHHQRELDPKADATIRLTKDLLIRLITRQAGLKDLVFSDDLNIEGSRMSVLSLFSTFDRPDFKFAIVTP